MFMICLVDGTVLAKCSLFHICYFSKSLPVLWSKCFANSVHLMFISHWNFLLLLMTWLCGFVWLVYLSSVIECFHSNDCYSAQCICFVLLWVTIFHKLWMLYQHNCSLPNCCASTLFVFDLFLLKLLVRIACVCPHQCPIIFCFAHCLGFF